MSEIDFENVGFGTLAIHAGQEPDKLYGALATPIYQTLVIVMTFFERIKNRMLKWTIN